MGGVTGERRLVFHLHRHASSQDSPLRGCRSVLWQVTGAGLHVSCLRQAPPVLPQQITVLRNVCSPMTPLWRMFWTSYNLPCTVLWFGLTGGCLIVLTDIIISPQDDTQGRYSPLRSTNVSVLGKPDDPRPLQSPICCGQFQRIRLRSTRRRHN